MRQTDRQTSDKTSLHCQVIDRRTTQVRLQSIMGRYDEGPIIMYDGVEYLRST